MTRACPFALTAIFASGLVAPALADRLVSGGLSIEQAIAKAKDAGYADISKMNVDDGHWEGEGMKAGKHLEFQMDPKTGAIT